MYSLRDKSESYYYYPTLTHFKNSGFNLPSSKLFHPFLICGSSDRIGRIGRGTSASLCLHLMPVKARFVSIDTTFFDLLYAVTCLPCLLGPAVFLICINTLFAAILTCFRAIYCTVSYMYQHPFCCDTCMFSCYKSHSELTLFVSACHAAV